MHKPSNYIRFVVYIVLIVLVNLVGSTLFFRVDLTRDGIYSLSPESKKVVSTLTEPLTIKAFFTKNLPAPHNATEQYLRDLLEEYAVQGNKYFNYTIYDLSADDMGPEGKADKYREMAKSYGITPVQIQDIEKDEVKFKQAYMGLVILHGDMMEKIPTITSTDHLEYDLTTAILRLNNKVSALIGLKDKVKVNMFMSPSLGAVGPLMGIKDLDKFPGEVAGIVKKVQARNYDKLEFSNINPGEGTALEKTAKTNDLTVIKWPAIPEKQLPAGQGGIGLVMSYHGKTKKIPLLHVLRIPLFGTSYKLENQSNIEEAIDKGMESLIGINSDIGYLSDHGTFATSQYTSNGAQAKDVVGNFASILEKNYTLKDIALAKDQIPPTLGTLIIARPTKKFSDYELYQIDQALMRGTNLIIYTDSLKEIPRRGGQFAPMQGPQYVPMNTGLQKLLEHYGVRIKKSFVLDEHCYKQQRRQGGEVPLYFAPIIKNENINKNVGFLHGIKALIVLNASPLELNSGQLKKYDITATKLISSSRKSWELKDRINLNPMFMHPPPQSKEKSYALAYLLEGRFDSYFDGKPLPEMKKEEKGHQAENKNHPVAAAKSPDSSTGEGHASTADISSSGNFIARGKKSKIFIMASSSMLRDNLLGSENEATVNATFVMNNIDSFNGREGIAAMRSKKQSYNPLDEIPQSIKTAIKAFNIAGLPILIALFGLLIWGLRTRRKKAIRKIFTKA